MDLTDKETAHVTGIASTRYWHTLEDGSSTWCHACGKILIGRVQYNLTRWNLDASGHCRRCGTACAGVFEEKPGDWGSRRLPVRLADFTLPA